MDVSHSGPYTSGLYLSGPYTSGRYLSGPSSVHFRPVKIKPKKSSRRPLADV